MGGASCGRPAEFEPITSVGSSPSPSLCYSSIREKKKKKEKRNGMEWRAGAVVFRKEGLLLSKNPYTGPQHTDTKTKRSKSGYNRVV